MFRIDIRDKGTNETWQGRFVTQADVDDFVLSVNERRIIGRDPATLEIIVTDISAEEAQLAADKARRLASSNALKALDVNSLVSIPSLRDAVSKILDHLALK